MKSTVRAAVAVAVATAIGFGVTAPASSAAPKERTAHVKVAHGSGHQGGKAKGHATATAAFVRNVTRQAGRLQARVDAYAALVGESAEAATANAEAADALTAAARKLAAVTIESTKADRKAIRADVHTARKALAVVAEALLAGEEPVVDEPVNPEPDLDPAA